MQVIDTTPPVLTCNDVHIPTLPGTNTSVLASYGVVAFDNVEATNISCTPPPGSTFDMNSTTAVCVATDAANNAAACNIVVTVIDNQPPLVNCPASQTFGTFLSTNISSNFSMPTAWDNVDVSYATLTVNFGGSTYSLSPTATTYIFDARGTATMTYTAYDEAGLSGVCFWSVTAYLASIPRDTIPPNISSCPTPFTLYSAPSPYFSTYNSSFHLFNTTTRPSRSYALVNWTQITAADNSGFVSAFYLDWSPSLTTASRDGLGVGQYVVVFSATDGQGNTAYCVFLVAVWDIEPPRFANCPANSHYVTGPNPTASLTSWPSQGIYAIDNAAMSSPYGTCVSQPPGNCPSDGAAPNQAFNPGLYSFTYTAYDDSGNAAPVCRFNVSVIDNSPPVISGCGTNVIQALTSPGRATADISSLCPNLTITDNIGVVSRTVSSSPVGYTCATPIPITALSSVTITTTAMDAAGNSAVCVVYVTVIDRELPVLYGCNPTILYNEVPAVCDPGLSTATLELPTITATDNSGSFTINTLSVPANLYSGSAFPFGQTVISYTAQDPSYNRLGCTLRVTVRDTQPPRLLNFPNPNASTYLYRLSTDPGLATAQLELPNIIAVDNVAVQTQGYQPASYAAGPFNFSVGLTQLTYSASDTSLNLVTSSIGVIVIDNQPPLFVGCLSDGTNTYVFSANTTRGQPTALVDWGSITAVDNVDNTHVPISITSDPAGYTQGSLFRVGITTITYTATDSADNSNTCVFNVEITDYEPPMLLCPESSVISTLLPADTAALGTWRSPVATDNNFVSILALEQGSPSIGCTYLPYFLWPFMIFFLHFTSFALVVHLS